jgi:hypothetical protein
MARTSIFASVVCLLICQQASPIDKANLLSMYRNKYVVVTKEGLSTALQQGLASGTLRIPINEAGQAGQPNFIGGGDFTNSGISSHRQSASPGGQQLGRSEIGTDRPCGGEPIREGEVLKVSHVSLSGRLLYIDLTVLPHPAKCGQGVEPPIGRIAVETGRTELAIQAGKAAAPDIPDALASLAGQWLGPFDTAADVEKALGAPQTRVDLGDGKVFYKYQDMTVELQAGKVTEVRR